jgi:hypothetical protein
MNAAVPLLPRGRPGSGLISRRLRAFSLRGGFRTEPRASSRGLVVRRDDTRVGARPLRNARVAGARSLARPPPAPLSPALVELNRDAFIFNDGLETTVDAYAYRRASDLDEIILDDDRQADGA